MKPVLIWYCLFSLYHSVIYVEDFILFLYHKGMVISHYFCFRYHSDLYTIQVSSYLGRNRPSINMVKNGIDPNNTSSKQRFSHLDIPTKYQYLIGITTWILMGGFFDTIIDVDY